MCAMPAQQSYGNWLKEITR